LNQLEQLSFTHHRVTEIQAGKLDLLWVINLDFIQEPVVERTVIFKLQGADGMGNAFNRVALAMGKVIHGVNAPGVSGPVVLGMKNPVHDRIPHVEIGGSHVDLGSKNPGAVRKLAPAHALKKGQVLLRGTDSVRALFPRLCQGPPVFPDLLCTEIIHIGFPLQDQPHGEFIELLKIVGGIVLPIFPVKTEPTDIGLDRLHVFDVLLAGIRVVEAQIAEAFELEGKTEIEADGLGVTDMEVAVWLRRKARVNPAAIFVRLQVISDDVLDEIGGRGEINGCHGMNTPFCSESGS